MAGEIQEPFNLSLLENSIHSGSVSFGRFEKEALSWEKRSSFSHNRYLEEAEKFSKPGSVTQMRAHFEAHFKTKGIRFPSSVEAQTWGEHHHQTSVEKDENLWESMSQCSHYSYEQDKSEQEKSQFGGSCVSYDDDLSSLSVALEKTEIGCSERTLEDKVEETSSSTTTLKPLKNDRKAIPKHVEATKTATKKHVGITKGSSGCNTKTTIDTKRGKELKPKRIVKSVASQAPTSKKTESLIPLATNKFRSKNCVDSAVKDKRTTTNGFSFRTNERAQKKKVENVEAVARKDLNFKARPMPKSTQARPQHTSTGQAKAINDAQEHSSKASCDRSVEMERPRVSSILTNRRRIHRGVEMEFGQITATRPRERTQTEGV